MPNSEPYSTALVGVDALLIMAEDALEKMAHGAQVPCTPLEADREEMDAFRTVRESLKNVQAMAGTLGVVLDQIRQISYGCQVDPTAAAGYGDICQHAEAGIHVAGVLRQTAGYGADRCAEQLFDPDETSPREKLLVAIEGELRNIQPFHSAM